MVTAALPVSSPRLTDHPLPPAPRDGEDAVLAWALVSGDPTAFDRLYLAYRSLAFAAAFSLLHDASAAEDVIQDAFVRAWRSAAAYQPGRGSLRAWLLTIVRNTAIDQLRARGVASRHLPHLQRTAVSELVDDVSSTVSAAADASRLRDAMQALPQEQRQALELAFFAGLTHGEIAMRTGIPLGTVKGRVRLGLRRLRHDLADLAPESASVGHVSRHAA